MRRFLVITEKANGNYSAYSPDLPGCVATGETRGEAERNIYEANQPDVEGLVEGKLPNSGSHSFASIIAAP